MRELERMQVRCNNLRDRVARAQRTSALLRVEKAALQNIIDNTQIVTGRGDIRQQLVTMGLQSRIDRLIEENRQLIVLCVGTWVRRA